MSKSWGPGYFRSELFSPPPGFKAVREWYFKRIRKHHESLFGMLSESKEKEKRRKERERKEKAAASFPSMKKQPHSETVFSY